MKKTFIRLLVGASILGAVTLFAQEGATKAPEWTLTLQNKTYPLKQALAYETTVDDEAAIALILSGQKVTSEKLKEARESEKEGNDGDFDRPFLKLVFTKKTGELKFWSAGAGGTSIARRSGGATGQLKSQGGRVSGKATQQVEADEMFPANFDISFDLALPASAIKKHGPAANVKPTVTGIFKGNGKEAKLTYVSAHWREPFDDKPSIVLVLTEKDHSKDPKPDFNASFGKFGSALTISLHEDGSIFGCEVAHSAHQKRGFSSIGSIETTEFTYEDGKVEGELTTNGQVDTFGEKWEVKLKFVAPLGEIPKEFQVAEVKKPEKQATPADNDADDNVDLEALTKSGETSAAAGGLKAKDLVLTRDATDVEYKGMVEQLDFKSKSSVKSVCAELAASLKAQGWKNDGADMVNPQSSILKRKRGEASLTIFVKPSNGGSGVKMMTEGLSWD
ncbi:MAG: hypothetical protein ACR2II_00115 [Chthoniobacterales bacterium]